jgi:hypothetical protein
MKEIVHLLRALYPDITMSEIARCGLDDKDKFCRTIEVGLLAGNTQARQMQLLQMIRRWRREPAASPEDAQRLLKEIYRTQQ